jgi:12-oxophytodienoic acid reductase
MANDVDWRRQIPYSLLPFRKAFEGTFIIHFRRRIRSGGRQQVVTDGYTDLIAYGLWEHY